MTASLPNPFESPAEEAGDQSVDGTEASPLSAPKPRAPRTNPRRPSGGSKAAAQPGSKPRAPRKKPSTPRTSPAPVAEATDAEVPTSIDPGPPPPLPTDIPGLVIPPKPPLPPVPSLPADLAPVEPEAQADLVVGETEIDEPATDEPTSEAPAIDEIAPEEPAVEEPAVDEALVPDPVVEEPTVDEPAPEEALVEDAAVEEPLVEEPAPEEALLEEPAVEEPEAEIGPEQPVDPEQDPDSVPAEPEIAAADEASDVLVIESDPLDADDTADGDDTSDADLDLAPAIVVEPLAQSDAVVDTDTAVPALTLRGVTKVFGDTRAVDGIDLTVPAGSFYGLVGPNGAGKTTTLSMIAGLLRPDAGTISIGGIDASRKGAATKRLMGVLPDRLRTFDRLTGRQLLYYYGVLRGLPSAVVESRTADLARAFDLTGALGRSVSDYSAGMTKKVMLAGAMIHSPRLLVLDEPFEAVDPVSSAVILDILSTYVAHGGTVILSSHGMELVERVCSGVAVIVAGQVLAEGTVDEVRGESTLEQRFLELAGGLGDTEGLEWLHTFSD